MRNDPVQQNSRVIAKAHPGDWTLPLEVRDHLTSQELDFCGGDSQARRERKKTLQTSMFHLHVLYVRALHTYEIRMALQGSFVIPSVTKKGHT